MPTVNSKFNTQGQISNILLESIRHFKTKIKDIYTIEDVPVVSGNGNDVNRELGRTQKDVSYQKYFNITVASVEENEGPYNSFPSKKYGVANIRQNAGDYYYTLSLTPVACTLNVNFFTQSYYDLIQFSDCWVSNKREGTFQLLIGGKFPLDIQVQLEPTVSFPEKDLSSGNPYMATTVAKLYTYCGYIYKTPTFTNGKAEVVIETGQSQIVVLNNIQGSDIEWT